MHVAGTPSHSFAFMYSLRPDAAISQAPLSCDEEHSAMSCVCSKAITQCIVYMLCHRSGSLLNSKCLPL